MRKLLEHRNRAGLTQFELAHRAGISLSQYSEIESGRADPRLKTAKAIAAVLEVKLEDLWPPSDSEAKPA